METRKTLATLAEINITPMIDVLLVLLIIFMVVTPVAQRGLDAAIPQRNEDGRVSPATLVLEIETAGLALNHTPLASLTDLEERLRAALEGRSDRTLFVRAAGEVGYGDVIAALDVARAAGVDRIGIIGGNEPVDLATSPATSNSSR